ncbi:tryptophan halogenase family protein [Paraglaciecola sp.]|uniref:tryptophan halogenase family protein n=1 Tax=Paraglaciecola sp. TaxID=1920173 RepID=UPI0030F385F7
MPEPIKNIVIVGGGTAGWMAAAMFSQYIADKDMQVTLIESPNIGTIGVGEATIPNIVSFNKSLGIDEVELIKATQATFKLGIKFEDWYKKDSRFFHPFADYGLTVDNVEFHHYVNRLKAAGVAANIQDYSFACILAKQDKFAQPNPNPSSPLGDYSYAYHLDAALYAQFLQQFSVKKGIEHISADVCGANLAKDSGFIESVTLDDGRTIEADLFIDCSGFKGLLIGDAMGVGLEDLSHWLPCDRAVAVQTELVGMPTPYTRAIAKNAGWQWCIPLQHRMGNGYIYSSQFIDNQQAEDALLSSVEGKTINSVRQFDFPLGKRKVVWEKNCFALGLAGGFLEPLESTGLSLIQTALSKLLTFFPDKSFNQYDIAEVNRLHDAELERIVDFLVLHYKLTKRDDTEFWRYCQNMPIPDSLAHKLEVFKSQGQIVMYAHESFEEASWLSMYHGFNVTPQRYDVRAKNVDVKLIEQRLQQIHSSMSSAVNQAMTHQEFINKHCRAKSDI